MWQTKYALAVTINLGLGFDFWLCSEGDFLTIFSKLKFTGMSKYFNCSLKGQVGGLKTDKNTLT